MKTCLLLLILVPIISCKVRTNVQESFNVINETDEATLRFVKEVEWPKAYAEHDTVLLDRILGEDFVMIDQDGNWYTKSDEIAWIKENSTDNDSFRYEIKRLEIFPNGTAIVCGTGHILKDSVKSVYQSSNLFIKRDNVWKAVQSHVSGVKEVE